MIGEIVAEHAWLWTFVWQSGVCVAVGLGGSFVWRHRPARAHRLLFIAMIAAVVVPASSQLVKQREWGLFEAAPAESAPLSVEPPAAAAMTPTVGLIEGRGPRFSEPVPTLESAPVSAPFDWLGLLVGLWAAGSALLLVRLAIRFGLAVRLIRRATTADMNGVGTAIGIAQDRLGINGDIAALRSDRVRSPMVWCWGRGPTLLMPADASNGGRPLDLVGVVCHELAHWRRRDHVTGLLAELMVVALPWQALLWWAGRRLVRLSEEACDDWVVACGHQGVDYAETLLMLTPHGYSGLVPAVVSSKHGVLGRIQRILKDRCATPHIGLRWSVAAVVVAGSLGLSIAFAQSRPGKPESREPVISARGEAIEDGTVEASTVRLQLVDPHGQPVAGARIARSVRVREQAVLGSRLRWDRRAYTSSEEGYVTFDIMERFRPQMDHEVVYVLHEDQMLGAMLELVRSDAGKALDVWLAPVCHVHGTVDSADLKALGVPLSSATVDVMWRDQRPLNQMLHTERSFTFLLPPGQYKLFSYGSGRRGTGPFRFGVSTEKQIRPFEVKQGQRELDLGVTELGSTRLARLIGKPAPELGPITSWKNGSAVTLADLKGQVVYLYFDGESPNSSRDLPRLVGLHRALGDRGLTIIALYNCASLEELERNWDEVHQQFGGVREVPFRMAIDGGEPTFYEGTDKERAGATYGRYDITMIPTSVLIDAEGRVVGRPSLLDAKETISAMLGVSVEAPGTEAWRAAFEAVYRLEEGEILKRVAPPFIPERMDFYRTEEAGQAELIPRGPDRMIFHWNGTLRRWGMGFGRVGALDGILNHVLRLRRYEYEGPADLLGLEMPGDWIIQDERPEEEKLGALEGLIEVELGRAIRFEKRAVDRDVIVATGRFKFHPPVEADEDGSLHIYADGTAAENGGGGGTAETLAEFLQALGDRVDMRVIDRTEPGEEMRIPYRHHHSSSIHRETDEQERARKLRLVLDHLSEQTELEFEVTTESVEVWFIREEVSN